MSADQRDYNLEFEGLDSSRRGLRVLSLDGGGIRGVATIEFLKEIEQVIGVPIREYFDVIVGTSTGGLITSGLVYGKMSLQQCEKFYDKSVSKIFEDKSKVRVVSDVLMGNSLGNTREFERNLMEAFGETCLFEETSPKVIMTATQYQDTNFSEFLFRNFQKVSDLNQNDSKTNFTQSEILRFRHEGDCWSSVFSALRSTTAAPIYFNPFHLDYRNPVTNLRKLITFQDGGLVANNPTEIGLSEIFDFWPQHRIDLIVSLGTGRADKKNQKNSNAGKISNAPDPTTNISHLVKTVINHACDCEKTHKKSNEKNKSIKATISKSIWKYRIFKN